MGRKRVCIQGLGFVGAAMTVAVANAKDNQGAPLYDVVGVDLPSEEGERRAESLRQGVFPFPSNDEEMSEALRVACEQGNLSTSIDSNVYADADVIVVDVHLDVDFGPQQPAVHWDGFKSAIKSIASVAKEGALILLETTVPPGTTEEVVAPLVASCAEERGMPQDAIHIAHSYERVMPGPDYYRSIVKFWRVYSGVTQTAKEKCREFLSTIIDTNEFPLTELERPRSSELAKVMENSYRATNIAFIQEWTSFADSIGVDLFSVIDAIRVRPTHNNIRFPGFGVGGYCLTKDPAFPGIAARNLFDQNDASFPFCEMAMRTNNQMPMYTAEKLKELLSGELSGKKILVAGISYRSEVGDSRFSPAELFVGEVERLGGECVFHDPYLTVWEEMGREVLSEFPAADGFDAVVFAVNHKAYQEIDLSDWLSREDISVLDAHNVLSSDQRAFLATRANPFFAVGRGNMKSVSGEKS